MFGFHGNDLCYGVLLFGFVFIVYVYVVVCVGCV